MVMVVEKSCYDESLVNCILEYGILPIELPIRSEHM